MLAARFATHRGSHRLVGKLHQRLSLGGAQVVRTFSASNEKEPTFSQYEYPSRTEAPEITTTNAKDITLEQIDSSTTSKLHLEWDPFDDQSKFTPSERDKLRSSLKASLDSLKLSTLPITENVPDFIPPNFPSGELQVPLTEITTLDNGVRVVSQETYGQMTTVAVLTNVGSRHESTPGVMHTLETMAFGSTKNYDGLEITQLLQDWGATRFVSNSREQTLHCIDILRPNVQQGIKLLADVVLEPKITDSLDDFYYALDVMAFQAQERPPEFVLGEAIQMAAYGPDQQLGKLHFVTPEMIPNLTPETVATFLKDNIRQNPKDLVVSGAGIGHDELVSLAQEYFGHMKQESSPTTIPSQYRGGSEQFPSPELPSVLTHATPEEEFCRVALAFPIGGWHSESMVTACVLQMLLGGGSSFSAGGPGKGMYSRMYQQVLNRYDFLESAESFTSFADEGGLFGVSARTANPERVTDLVTIIASQLASVAVSPVSEIELSRARNRLKCEVLIQLESRLILCEDLGRQVLTYGKREDSATTCARIDAVTAQDIQKLAQEMLRHNPTLASTGYHLERVPTHEEVSRWFTSGV